MASLACSPLIKSDDLISAASLFAENGSNSPVLAVSQYPVPIGGHFDDLLTKTAPAIQPGKFAVRSQDIEKTYYDTGSFQCFPQYVF